MDVRRKAGTKEPGSDEFSRGVITSEQKSLSILLSPILFQLLSKTELHGIFKLGSLYPHDNPMTGHHFIDKETKTQMLIM